MKTITPLLLCTCLATPAFALNPPVPSKGDARCRVVDYDESNITPLTTYVDRVTSIKLGETERIERFMLGQEGGPLRGPDPKQVGNQPLHSVLPVWGATPGTTNVLVLSLMPDDMTEHSYQFLVTVKPALKENQDDSDATYCLKFTYQAEQKQQLLKQAIASAPKRRVDAEREKAEARLRVDPFYGEQNWKYIAMGDKTIAPTAASDNFNITAFRYPGNMPQPAILEVDSPAWCNTRKPPPDSYLHAPEHAVRPIQKDDLLTVDHTAEHWRLRMGQNHIVEVFNCGYDAIGHNPGTGTTSPNVVREVITSK